MPIRFGCELPRVTHGSDEAINTVLDLRFGENRVAYDPSDPEGTKIAVTKRIHSCFRGCTFSGRVGQCEAERRNSASRGSHSIG
jgi:hypothetical protein